MVYLLLLLQLLVLFFSSRFLFRSIFTVAYRISRSKHVALYTVMVIFFFGTLIHELSHFLMATMLFLRTGEIRLWPEITEDGYIRLGSVGVQKTDIIRRFLVGVAPVVMGSLIIALIGFYIYQQIQEGVVVSLTTVLIALGLVYAIFVITNTMFSSRKDMEGAIELLAILGVICVSIIIAGQSWIFFDIGSFFMKDQVRTASEFLAKMLLIPCIINITFVGIVYVGRKR